MSDINIMINTMKSIYKHKIYFAIFIFIESLLYLSVSAFSEYRINEYFSNTSHTFESEYQRTLHSYQDKAEIAFHTLIDTKSVKTLLKSAQDSNEQHKDLVRKSLYDQLLPEYEHLREFGFKQVHFHTQNNHSFLRMHAPEHYGDDLSSFRKTVQYVNKTHQSIYGFEEGIAKNGFRFVYPLFLEKDYLGSVELSFPVDALSKNLNSDFLQTRFVIAKSALVQNTARGGAYVTSKLHPDFMIDKRNNNSAENLPFEEKFDAYLKDKNLKDKSFSFSKKVDDRDHIISFLPVQNPITKQTNAYLVILSNGKYLKQLTQYFWMGYAALSLIVFLLYMRYIKEHMHRKKINDKNSELALANSKLKTILDSQNNLIIITDGSRMIDANAKVLEFFGFDSMDQFYAKHPCICHFFIKHDDYFHLDLVPEEDNWINFMQTLPDKKKVVNMVSKDMESKAFQVKINDYGLNSKYIITFSDITDMLIEQRILKYQAQHDKLTNIYNRQKIDQVLQQMCDSKVPRKEEVGVVMFDIDLFKQVNDQYGHNIGDKVLKSVTNLVKKSIRQEDIFGRWGGEEFILIMRHSNIDDTYHNCERLRVLIEQFKHKDLPRITVSFGLTSLQSNDNAKSLIKRADIALYEAKRTGRNRVALYRSQKVLEETIL